MRRDARAAALRGEAFPSTVCSPCSTESAVSRSERSRPWKTIRSVVAGDGSVLGTLVRQADELRRCEESLKGYLDVPGAGSLRIAAIEGGAIVVVVDSAAQGARLRFLAPRIVARAARLLGRADLDRLDVRVRPPR